MKRTIKYFKGGLKGSAAKVLLIMALMISTGCGENNPAGLGTSTRDVESADKIESRTSDRSAIRLDLGITSVAARMSESRLMYSNNGNSFNNIVPVKLYVGPGESVALNEIQSNGIFALYLNAESDFTLTNSDGLNLSVKSIMLERCSFIDLTAINHGQNEIVISGFLAGE